MARNRVTFSLDWISLITSVGRAGNVVLGVALALASAASAQVPVVGMDTSTHRIRLNATALRPGQFVYQMTLERDASTTIVGTRTVSVSAATYVGTPAWLLLETRTGEGINAIDSLYTDFATLRPLRWSALQGIARLAAEFHDDSAFGGTTAPPGRRSMAAPAPPGTLVSGAMLETALRLQPLANVWEDSASTLSVSIGGNSLIPTRLAVIGEDRVRVPAGVFDCWVVAVHADSSRGLFWVTKQDPIVARTVLDVPTLNGAQLVSALTRIER